MQLDTVDAGVGDSVELKTVHWYASDSDGSGGVFARFGSRDPATPRYYASRSELESITQDSAFNLYMEADPTTQAFMQGVETDILAEISAGREPRKLWMVGDTQDSSIGFVTLLDSGFVEAV